METLGLQFPSLSTELYADACVKGGTELSANTQKQKAGLRSAGEPALLMVVLDHHNSGFGRYIVHITCHKDNQISTTNLMFFHQLPCPTLQIRIPLLSFTPFLRLTFLPLPLLFTSCTLTRFPPSFQEALFAFFFQTPSLSCVEN